MPGGGVGRSVWAASALLAGQADVTVVTSEHWRGHYEALREASDSRLPPGVRFAFASEPEGELSPYASWLHAWSVRLMEAVIEAHPEGGPDLIEAGDYHGEGFAIAHALRGRDPRLRRTRLAVRLHTSAELTAKLDERPDDLNLRILRGIERFAIAHADVLLEPGGTVMDRYRHFYGADRLAPSVRCPPPVSSEMMPTARLEPPPSDGLLRILYLGRLQRLKGIDQLLLAFRGLDSDVLRLTVAGGDTDTAPGGGSMREYAENLVREDGRVSFVSQVPHDQIGDLIAEHHLLVVPSRWESSPYVVREALACNRPVLATPVGSVPAAIDPGRSGWLARSGDAEDLRASLGELLRGREEIDGIISDGLPRRGFDAGTNERDVAARYAELCAHPGDRSTVRHSGDMSIDAIVAIEPDGPGLAPTLRSLAGQRGAAFGITAAGTVPGVAPAPRNLIQVADVVAPSNGSRGRIAAWTAGSRHAVGDLLLFVPAGAELSPDFVARAAAALAAEPRFAYVTAFVAGGREPWHAPAGNFELPREIDFGASVALIRRDAFAELIDACGPPRDEAELFGMLGERRQHGVVLHEPLVRCLPRRSGEGLISR